MKKKLFLYFYIFCSFIYAADQIEITHKSTNIEEFSIGYLYDDNNSLKIEDVINRDFIKTTNRVSHGINHDVTWYKIEIKNTTNMPKTINLHNDFAYMYKSVSIFEFMEKSQIDQNIYNLADEDIGTKLSGSSLVYTVILPKNGTSTVYIKNHTLSYQVANFNIYDEHHSIEALIGKNFYSNIVLAILFIIATYNVILFFFTKRREFIFYSLYLYNAFLGLFYLYGTTFHNFSLYSSKIHWLNLTAVLVSPLFVLFVKTIFDTQKTEKKIDKILNSVIYFSILYIATAIFVNFDFTMKIVGILFLYTFIVLIYTGIYFYVRKHLLAKLFLLAYLVYIFGMGFTLYFIMGYASYNSYIFHASGIGLVLEALLFSYLIHYRMELLELAVVKHQKSLIFKNKKAQMGDMMGAITHQWKQPLTAISSIVTGLEYRLDKQKEISAEYLNPKLSQINEKIVFLVETIEDFKHFFNPERINEDVDVSEIIARVILLSRDDMLSENISIKCDLNFTKTINLYPNELLHIILNLMQNSNEAFEKNKIEHKLIKIVGMTKEDKTIIDIIDNAGGIPEEMLAKVFGESFTTKKDKVGSGLGLYLSKFILEEHMNGSIEVKKIENGTMFRIIL